MKIAKFVPTILVILRYNILGPYSLKFNIHTAPQPVVVDFSPHLSVDEFMSYLKKEGLSSKDCEIMRSKSQQIAT